MTNYEKIKNMNIKDMAEFINIRTNGCMFRFICPCECEDDTIPKSCADRIEQWLNSEVESEN